MLSISEMKRSTSRLVIGQYKIANDETSKSIKLMWRTGSYGDFIRPIHTQVDTCKRQACPPTRRYTSLSTCNANGSVKTTVASLLKYNEPSIGANFKTQSTELCDAGGGVVVVLHRPLFRSSHVRSSSHTICTHFCVESS